MKFAQVTPLYETLPPNLYGGTERVVAHLTDALVELAHDVTLFASADATPRARLIPVRDQAKRLDRAPQWPAGIWTSMRICRRNGPLPKICRVSRTSPVTRQHSSTAKRPGSLSDRQVVLLV